MSDVRDHYRDAPAVLHPDDYYALQRGLLWCKKIVNDLSMGGVDHKQAKQTRAAAERRRKHAIRFATAAITACRSANATPSTINSATATRKPTPRPWRFSIV